MGKRTMRWARKHAIQLRLEMGRRCKWPGCRRVTGIQFDCIIPKNDGHGRKLSWDQRIRYYKRQRASGNLRLLCRKHNAQKGATTDKAYHKLKRELANVVPF